MLDSLKFEFEILFTCNEPSIPNSEFCIFHDKDRYAEYEHEAVQRFEDKVRESISKNKPLECIGYYLPSIDFSKLLKGEKFGQPVNFYYATFSKEANFAHATFSKEANFAHATFSKEANFRNTTFSKEANFAHATFIEGANFWDATFTERADFFLATFTKRAIFKNATFSNIAIFINARFEDEAIFYNARFFNIAIFRLTSFKKADFLDVSFSKEASFDMAKFTEQASFWKTKFLDEAFFRGNIFSNKAFFRYTIFEQPNKVIFDDNDLSVVSFADTDVTRIKFGDKITWSKGKDKFTIIEEKWLANKEETVSLELALSVYRNLRENYEYRLRYDDAGKFFVKEMELKRNYREVPSISDFKLKLVVPLHRKLRLKGDKSPIPEVIYRLEKNGWFRRHFSLTGLYYHLSRYGESISRPTLIAVITVILSTLFWVTQGNPTLEPHFDPTQATNSTYSTFVGFEKANNATQWLEGFERSLADFLPLLSLGGDIKVGIIDYIIKVFGGGLTFVLLAIALRRKFERKYTR